MAKGAAGTPAVIQAPRGTQDIVPPEQKYWEYVTETAKAVLRGWDFERLDTPIFEETGLFIHAVGDESDIARKELFELKVRGGGAAYSLRPEGTAPVVRAYIERGMRSWPKPVKLFYLGPFFRYDRPQAGRWRQFHQFGLELFGSAAPVSDVQIMFVSHVLLQQLGLEDYQFQINSLGSPGDRGAYIKVLKEHYRRSRAKLCRDCKERLKTNPLRVLDCKEEKCQQVAKIAPRLTDYLSDEAKQHFENVVTMLEKLEVPHQIASGLVRGLDYYSGIVWEVLPRATEVAEAGQQQALGGGGRYDGLVKQLGGKDVPALGAAFGIERIIDRLKQEGVELTDVNRPRVFVAQLGEAAKLGALKVMRRLQEAQIHFAESIDREGMQQQLKQAGRIGASWVVIVGQKEVLDKTVILRNMASGMQEVIDQEVLAEELGRRLDLP